MALAPEIGHPSVRSTESGWLYNQGREMQLVHTQMQGRPRKPQEVLPGKEAGGEREGEAQGKRISYFLRRLTLVPEEQGSTFHVLPALACAATLSPPPHTCMAPTCFCHVSLKTRSWSSHSRTLCINYQPPSLPRLLSVPLRELFYEVFTAL